MKVEIVQARIDQESHLLNLLKLYFHDLSEFTPWLFNSDEPFEYPDLPSYWRDPALHPFLLYVAGATAGFALVQQHSHLTDSPNITDIAEFFVLRAYRGRDIGSSAAHTIFRRFPGSWEVRVRECNSIGCDFGIKRLSHSHRVAADRLPTGKTVQHGVCSDSEVLPRSVWLSRL